MFQLFQVIGFQSEQGSADYCQAQVGRPVRGKGQGANRDVLSFEAHQPARENGEHMRIAGAEFGADCGRSLNVPDPGNGRVN